MKARAEKQEVESQVEDVLRLQHHLLASYCIAAEPGTSQVDHFVLLVTGYSKHVSWLLGRDGDVRVSVIGELDEFRSSRVLQSLMNDR